MPKKLNAHRTMVAWEIKENQLVNIFHEPEMIISFLMSSNARVIAAKVLENFMIVEFSAQEVSNLRKIDCVAF